MAGELLLEAYPLTWPERQRRTPSHQRRHAAFKLSLGQARDELMRELGLLGARHVVVSTNVPVRRDGLPLADAREPVDPGVAVYFERRRIVVEGFGGVWTPFVIACDTYCRVKWNLRAVGVTVEALRAIQRHGASEMLEQAFTGFAALPAHIEADPPWWETLGVSSSAPLDEVEAAWRALAAVHHPDVGGTHERMSQINRARDRAREVRRTS